MTEAGESRSAPLLLIVDTTIAGVAMGLVRPGGKGDSSELAAGLASDLVWHGAHHDHAGSVPAISTLVEQGLDAVGATLADVGGISVSSGPGSFTGIKIGLAFVYGLRRRDEVGTLVRGTAAIQAAAGWLEREAGGVESYVLLLPATRTHGFLATSDSSSLLDVTDAALVAARIGALPPGARLAVSGRWPAATEAAKAHGRSVLEIAPSEVSLAAIYGMSEEASRQWPHGFGAALPAPRYLRLSTAEERLRGGVS